MLFRAVAPLSVVKDVLRSVAIGQSVYTQGQILDRLLDPERRDILTLETSRKKWEAALVKTQATPAKLSRGYHRSYPYQDKDVIWLSDHDGEDSLFCDAEFDLFIHEAK